MAHLQRLTRTAKQVESRTLFVSITRDKRILCVAAAACKKKRRQRIPDKPQNIACNAVLLYMYVVAEEKVRVLPENIFIKYKGNLQSCGVHKASYQVCVHFKPTHTRL